MPPSSPLSRPRASPRLIQAARAAATDVVRGLESSSSGLAPAVASARLATYGANVLGSQDHAPRGRMLLRAVGNPLVVLLAILSASAWLGGDAATAAVMVVMMAIGVGVRFVQEARADAAAAGLRAMIRVHATVVRDGRAEELPIADLVPGDVVRLAAGDMVPADVRLIAAKDLSVTQAILSGESFPVEKDARPAAQDGDDPLGLASVCFLGTSVESGTAEAVVVETGRRTLLGSVAATLELPEEPTAFDTGLARFTWLMVTLAAVMVPMVFVINGLGRGDWWQAFFFALAVAVGLTPEMLPMVVGVCLARGAIAMSGKRVIVRHLDAIQNLGAMDVLCTDKTGTLTLDRVILERHCDVRLREDLDVLAMAWLTSHFQTGLRNLLDRAILEHEELREHVPHAGYEKIDEIPFDFARRRMSVVVATPTGTRRLVCKGAVDSVFARCTAYELDGRIHRLPAGVPADLVAECDALARDGFRVLAIAYRDVESREAYARDDERDLVLRGYVAFLDPPRDSAAAAVAALESGGIAVKVLTGDNDLVSRTICRAVGIATAHVLVGHEIDALDDTALAAAAERTTLFARLTPAQKERVVTLLRRGGHVVGFLGDGANDAPALRAADVGISVDTAVDIARESADCILLEKSLLVLRDGVHEGRKVFVNVLKYIRMGASSNFGNMFSMLAASLMLPFLPMTPLQILATNLLYDCSQVPIPTDDVDPEQVARPRPWSIREITAFILLIGPLSSIFDLTTFAVLLWGFGWSEPGQAGLFHSGWFVESLLTQVFIIHVIRTDRVPFVESRASPALLATTAAVMLCGAWLPASALGQAFGFTPLPAAYWPFVIATLALYAAVTYAAKAWLVRRGWLA